MDSVLLTNFNIELSQIHEYIKHIEIVNTLSAIKTPELNHLELVPLINQNKVFYKDKRAFEYKAVIISLYGILEKHIEIFIKEYLTSLSKIIIHYNDLNKTIINNHFNLSLNLIKKTDYSKFNHLDKDNILNILNNCIKCPENYELNLDSFIISSNGNLKHEKICGLFSGINVKLDSLLKNSPSFSLSENSANVFNTIDELVDRRNDTAHGADNIDRLNNTELIVHIDFLEKYFTEIFNILKNELLQNEYQYQIKKEIYKEINILKKYKNNTIIGFYKENFNYQIGERVLIKTKDNFTKDSIINFEEHTENRITIEFENSCISSKSIIFLKPIVTLKSIKSNPLYKPRKPKVKKNISKNRLKSNNK